MQKYAKPLRNAFTKGSF